MNKNAINALKEYREKLASGELVRTKPSTPKQRHKKDPLSLRKSIDAFCYQCICEVITEITLCTAKNCPLYKVRPYQKKE